MSRVLALRNRQRARGVNTRLLRRLAAWALREFKALDYELGVHLVTAEEMASVNETFLDHAGSTDVVTFDHREVGGESRALHGEIFISIDDAVAQARTFRTTWQQELTRYLLHGLLHLHGFDDTTPVLRRKMKREETRLFRRAGREFRLDQLGSP